MGAQHSNCLWSPRWTGRRFSWLFPTITVTLGAGQTVNTLPNGGQATMANSLPVAVASDQIWPKTTALASLVIKGSSGSLVAIQCLITTASGWFYIFDATSLPSNGTVGATVIWQVPIDSNGQKGYYEHSWWPSPLAFAAGCVAAFSTTGPYNLTASATAGFVGQTQ